ncbi:hypothetical protein [Dactylosporangium sp. CA-233914]|uniref:hypothetical protein n=1 Tax=Dactylosporangium sp. CA-233914 TaxID=3239934 RepID=UPI003D89FBDB
MDDHSAFGDLDGDHVVDTQAFDVNGDGHFDVQYTDTNHDGFADVMLVDTNGDGLADVQYMDLNHDGHADVMYVDGNADGLADQAYTAAGPFDTGHADASGSYPQTQAVSSGPFPTDGGYGGNAGYLGLTGDNAAVASSVNSLMHDAGTIYHEALNPGSQDPGEVQAATEHASNAARNAQSMQGYTYQRQVSNDIHQGDLDRQASEQAHQQATDNAIETDRATSQADWAVWESKMERGA